MVQGVTLPSRPLPCLRQPDSETAQSYLIFNYPAVSGLLFRTCSIQSYPAAAMAYRNLTLLPTQLPCNNSFLCYKTTPHRLVSEISKSSPKNWTVFLASFLTGLQSCKCGLKPHNNNKLPHSLRMLEFRKCPCVIFSSSPNFQIRKQVFITVSG